VDPGAKRSAAAAFASSVEGRLEATTSRAPFLRTALRMRRSRIGASSTGSVSITRMAPAWSMSDTRAESSGRASARACAGPSRPARRESTFAEPSPARSRCCSRNPSSLVVWPPASAAVRAPDFASAAAASESARSQVTSRRKPPSRTIGAVMRSSEEKDW